MPTPKISVIMSAYNSAQYIGESISSVLNQTFRDFELIIVNDYSTDNTLEVIKTYSVQDYRIVVINNDSNLQQAISRNKAAKIARGEYIAILDSDDISLPHRLEVQYDYSRKHPDIVLIGCGAEIINDSGSVIGRKHPSSDLNKLKFELTTTNPIVHSGVFYKKTTVDSLGGYNNNYLHSEDYKLYSDLINKDHKITNLPNILIKYRHSSSAISRTKSTRKVQLDHAFAISFENITKYIQLPKESAQTFINTVQKINLNLSSVLSSIKIYKKLTAAFVSKEKLNLDQTKDFWNIYNQEKKKLLKEYLKQKFPIIINAIKSIAKTA